LWERDNGDEAGQRSKWKPNYNGRDDNITTATSRRKNVMLSQSQRKGVRQKHNLGTRVSLVVCYEAVKALLSLRRMHSTLFKGVGMRTVSTVSLCDNGNLGKHRDLCFEISKINKHSQSY